MLRSPGLKHQQTLSQFLTPLFEVAERERRGLLIGGCGVVLSPETLVVPDLLFVSHERRHIIGHEYIEGAPDLLAEVISPSSGSIDR